MMSSAESGWWSLIEMPTARHLAGALQVVERAAPVVAIDPLGVPDVQLEQVDGGELEVLEALSRRTP